MKGHWKSRYTGGSVKELGGKCRTRPAADRPGQTRERSSDRREWLEGDPVLLTTTNIPLVQSESAASKYEKY